jgi:hypothetical protein
MADQLPGSISVRGATIKGTTYNFQVVRTGTSILTQIRQQLKGSVDEHFMVIVYNGQRLTETDTVNSRNVGNNDVFDIMSYAQ